MIGKIVFVLLAGCTAVLASPLPDTTNPLQGLSANQLQILQQQLAGSLPALQQQLAANLPALQQQLGQFQNAPQQSLHTFEQTIGELVRRLSSAYVSTYDQQRDSFHNTLNNVKDMGIKGVQSTADFTRNVLQLLHIIPTYGRNVLANGAQPQLQQQLQQLQNWQ